MLVRCLSSGRYYGFSFSKSRGVLQNYQPDSIPLFSCQGGLGADNDDAYRQVIGLSDDEIADLEKIEVIGDLSYDWAGPMPDYLVERL